MNERVYRINEFFYSIQGEGALAGSPSVFVRFAGCNLRCTQESVGFDCDTEFTSAQRLTSDELVSQIIDLLVLNRVRGNPNIVFTGGEPTLQLDNDLIHRLADTKRFGKLCLETNGLRPVSQLDLDWVAVSPKTAEHTLKATMGVMELRYVRNATQGIPEPAIEAPHRFISPAWELYAGFERNLAHCIRLVRENPPWRLSVQQHKQWGVR